MPMKEQTTDRLRPRAWVLKVLGVSQATLWRMERRGDFVRARQIAPGRVGYLESEVLEWMRKRPRTA